MTTVKKVSKLCSVTAGEITLISWHTYYSNEAYARTYRDGKLVAKLDLVPNGDWLLSAKEWLQDVYKETLPLLRVYETDSDWYYIEEP